MPNRKNVPAFSAFLYLYRNLVERCFNKIKHYRAVATRYDKRPANFLAGVKLASLKIWMRFNESIGGSRERAIMATVTSELPVRLIDGVSGPAKAASASLRGLNAAGMAADSAGR